MAGPKQGDSNGRRFERNVNRLFFDDEDEEEDEDEEKENEREPGSQRK